jgi:methylated-DNA-protein-cysteine methyltransferase related protein
VSGDDTFAQRVYELVQEIPAGEVATYGQIATYAGSPRAARAVGNLMRASLTNGVDVPWHRVINSQGRISGRGDVERAELQRRLLVSEGICFDSNGRCDLDECEWEPLEIYWDG